MSRFSCVRNTLGYVILLTGAIIYSQTALWGADKAEVASKKAADAKGEVTVEAKSFAEVTKIIESHKGKVIVIDCWATYCEPCKKEFPHLIELSHKHSRDKVQCMSLSFDNLGIDPVEELLPKVKEFLVKQKADAVLNFVATDESDDLYKLLKFSAIPAVIVYDTQGKQAKLFDNSDPKAKKFTYADVEKLVEELIAAGAKK